MPLSLFLVLGRTKSSQDQGVAVLDDPLDDLAFDELHGLGQCGGEVDVELPAGLAFDQLDLGWDSDVSLLSISSYITRYHKSRAKANGKEESSEKNLSAGSHDRQSRGSQAGPSQRRSHILENKGLIRTRARGRRITRCPVDAVASAKRRRHLRAYRWRLESALGRPSVAPRSASAGPGKCQTPGAGFQPATSGPERPGTGRIGPDRPA